MRLNLFKIWKENFRVKIFGAFVLVIFFASASFSIFFLDRQREMLTHELIKDGNLLSGVLAYNSRIGVFAENDDSLEITANGILRQEGILQVSIFNLEGKLLKSAEKREIRTPGASAGGDEPARRKIMETLRETAAPFSRSNKDVAEFWSPVVSAAEPYAESSLFFKTDSPPVSVKRQVIGYAMIMVDKRPLNKALKDSLFKTILICFAFLFAGSVVAYLVVQGITKPLNRLIGSVKSFGTAGRVEAVAVETGDEIGDLARTFNAMADRLEKREKALRESEDKYRQLSNSITDIFFAVDADLKCTYWNKATEEITGIAEGDAAGKPIHAIFPGLIEGGEERGTGDPATRDREPRRFLYDYQKGEELLTFEVSLYPARSGLSVYAKDVTERKRAEEALRASNEQMCALSARVQAVREEERKRIAREIHDELGGALTSIKIGLSLLKRTTSGVGDQDMQDSLQDKMNDLSELTDTTMHTVHRIAMELRPGILDDLGLVAALEWQLNDFRKRTGVHCEFISSAEYIALEEKEATALFRIFQEILTNVARHSGADAVRVNLHVEADLLRLEVEDNGSGIKEEEIRNPKSLGLLGIRERAMLFGGSVTITGRPGKGTRVTIEKPALGKGIRDGKGLSGKQGAEEGLPGHDGDVH